MVTDASGAAIPDARVTITDEQTGVKTVVGTNSAGNYSTPPLILGTYRVDIEKQGFKTFSRTGYALTGGQTVRVDANARRWSDLGERAGGSFDHGVCQH